MADDDGAWGFKGFEEIEKRHKDFVESARRRHREAMKVFDEDPFVKETNFGPFRGDGNLTRATRTMSLERRKVTGREQALPSDDVGNFELRVTKSLRCLTLETPIQDQVPEYWSEYKSLKPVKDGPGYVCVRLSSGSVWYKEVSCLVNKTWEADKVGRGMDAAGLGPHGIRIRNISRIENPKLYNSYMNKKQAHCLAADCNPCPKINDLKNECKVETSTLELTHLESTLSSNVNEYFLLHGTKEDIVDSIRSEGLDSRLSRYNALFGAGVYFTESSTKADQYADSQKERVPDGRPLYMYVCRVLLGSPFICRTPQRFRRPPCKKRGCTSDACSEHKDVGLFDSVIGTHKSGNKRLLFREFIVYHPDQSYPDFLVEYERESL